MSYTKGKNIEHTLLKEIETILKFNDPDSVKASLIINRMRSILGIADLGAASDMHEALKDLIDPDNCSCDHHGYCQTHGWLRSGLCPQFRAKLAIAKAEGR